MKLTRHAANRMRWIGRRYPAVSVERLLANLRGAEHLGYDVHGNHRMRVLVAETALTVVVDEKQSVVVTIWVE